MIVVVGRIQTDDARRDELIRIGQRLAQASREETGCLAYRLYEDTERPNHFVFLEEWASWDALQHHFRTGHIAEFMRAVPAAVSAAPDVKFHMVERTADLAEISQS